MGITGGIMAGITLEFAQQRFDLYTAAEEKVLQGQSYRIGERELNRANLSHIREAIEYWDRQIKTLTSSASGRGRSVNLAPRW